jgi:DNA-binding FadR family transcriptional regulator
MDEGSGPDFPTVERSVLWQQIAEQLMVMLQDGRLQPGDKLPPERELAAMMQVSRPSLREALRALTIMNILEVRQGVGTFVTSLEPELLVEHLDFVLSLEDASLHSLFEARRIVEVGIMALAAERITGAELAELQAGLERSEAAIDDAESFMQADQEMHKAVTRAARNPIMSRVIDSISRLLLVSRTRTVEIPGIRAQTLEDHRAIVAALSARNPQAAQAAMLQHLKNVERRLHESERLAQKDVRGSMD